jgi:ethylbenzene dioxygenase alpha subunit
VGDSYHAPWTHVSGAYATLKSGVAIDQDNSYHASINGHGWEFGLDTYGNAFTMNEPLVIDYMKSRIESVRDRLGSLRSRMWGAVSSANVFPNFAFLPGYCTFRIFVPKGPHQTELHTWCLVNKNAPEEVKQAYRHGCMRTFSPSGVLEMDDGENWEQSTAMQSGFVTRQGKLHYGLGAHTRIEHDELPGIIHKGQMNDANQLLFYQRWADLMDADGWADVPDRTPTKTMVAAQ